MYNLILVDDESLILDQLCTVLPWEALGYTLAGRFTETQQALAFLRENTVDVLLTDIQLGSNTGLELALAARNMNPAIELVILSAYSDFEYARSALRLNVYDYLLKPVTYAALSACFEGLKAKLDARWKDGKSPAPADSETGDDNYRIAMVKRYIDKNVGGDITLESVSAIVSMNPAYFSRFFKRHTGQHFADYLTGRRMECAIDLLRDPVLKVFEISAMVGYFSKKNFYKRFKNYTGRTPSEYRNKVLKIEGDEDE
jgi:Response regulator containing CheY-like receiver domain and AraC-type DNA-binding domain